MHRILVTAITCASLFAAMLAVSIAGHRLGRRRITRGEAAPDSSSPVTGAIFALLGLLIAFTFSGAFARLEARRNLIVEEANDIGTAYLRLDLLPADAQAELRQLFRDYATARAAFFVSLTDDVAARAELTRAEALQRQIWARAVATSVGDGNRSARMLLLPALNQMIDITTTRTVAVLTHPPSLILITLILIACACAGLTGYNGAERERFNRVQAIGFAAVIAFTLFVILDIEYPRTGMVRLDTVNQLLVDLARSMQ